MAFELSGFVFQRTVKGHQIRKSLNLLIEKASAGSENRWSENPRPGVPCWPMDIFISWSGPRSRAVAEALKEYLPIIVNAFKPWLSADMDKGAVWASELTAALGTAKAGIICLTPNNLTAPYILFESGAISKTVDKSFVCTLLIEMEPSDVSGPLALFQATKSKKDDLLHLLKTLNKALDRSAVSEAQIETTFNLVWPKFKERLDSLPADGPSGRPNRSPEDLLEELVGRVRSISDGQSALLAQLTESMDRVASRLGGIDAGTSLFDKYVYDALGRKVPLNSLGQAQANVYGDLFNSDAGKIIDEALSRGSLARSYADAPKASSSETHPASSPRAPRVKRAPTLPIKRRRATREASMPKETP